MSSEYIRRECIKTHLSTAQVLKRALDVAVATTTLALLSPLMVIIAAIIKLSDGGPVLYWHVRIGMSGQLFKCVKFRSMVLDADAVFQRYLAENPSAAAEWQEKEKLSDDPRVKPFGKFLRRSSFDELPQLFNVLAGDMSLVGPRPITPQEMHRYGKSIGYYFSVKRGVTGLWQISGRSNCSFAERVHLDVRYVTDWTLWLDLFILLKTIPAVISQRGSC